MRMGVAGLDGPLLCGDDDAQAAACASAACVAPQAADVCTRCLIRACSACALIMLAAALLPCCRSEVCRQLGLRVPRLSVPVIMVSAHSEEAAVVHGLDSGADDYITKPFRRAEFLARIRTKLQMSGGGAAIDKVRCGACCLQHLHGWLGECSRCSSCSRTQAGSELLPPLRHALRRHWLLALALALAASPWCCALTTTR